MATHSKKPPSQRQLKVGEELRHALSDTFMREDFYNVETTERLAVTVSEVRVSADLRNATVYVIPFGGKNKESTMKSLDALCPRLRGLISRKVQLRFMPAILFRLDTTFERAQALEDIFNKPEVRRDIEKNE